MRGVSGRTRLCGDAGVVEARHPDDRLALHAVPAHERILDGAGQRMAKVERTCAHGQPVSRGRRRNALRKSFEKRAG